MNSLFENPGLEPIVIQIISYLDVESFLKVREVNKTLLHLIDNELSLWRNALKNQMRPIDMTKINKCDCNSWWENASKPFLKSLKALKLLVPFIFELQQRHSLEGFLKDSCIHLGYRSRSPFDQVCHYASTSLLELIINYLAQTENTAMEYRNVFETACYSGRLEAVQLIWKIWKEQGIDFDQKQSKAPKPFFSAFISNNPAIFQFVLDQGIDINEKDPFPGLQGGTIIHTMVGLACVRKYQENSEILLDNCQGKNIDWNVQDDNGDTPLLFALKKTFNAKMENKMEAYHLYLKALKNLLEVADTPMNLNLPNRNGHTAWQYVIQQDFGDERDEEVVKAVQKHLNKMKL